MHSVSDNSPSENADAVLSIPLPSLHVQEAQEANDDFISKTMTPLQVFEDFLPPVQKKADKERQEVAP